ncbi:MAG: hypothetical protein M1837_005056 [Sclerophora amabilis]|nr:MAG: hypothetical protein M1837_005056 [Sclerophora amabilis]
MMLLTDKLTVNDTQVCNFASHHSLVVGQKIYVDGGVYTSRDDVLIDLDYRDLQIYDLADLSDSIVGHQKVTIPKRTTVKRPDHIPNTKMGFLWTDRDQRLLLRYGGTWIDPEEVKRNMNDQAAKTALVGFDFGAADLHSSEAWTLQQKTTAPIISRLSHGAGARYVREGQGYYLGGFEDNIGNDHRSSKSELDSISANLIIWDSPLEWNNKTVRQSAVSDASYNPGAGGFLTHLPIGDVGMLLSVGGRQFEGPEAVRFPMDKIRLYDIKNDEWYTQTAEGEIPDGRNNFCGVTAVARDSSSYNIYISGGQTGDDSGADDVYILSVPSFTWFKAYSGKEIPRIYHTCELVQDQQMAVIGGYNATTLPRSMCAQEMGGDLRFFDLNTLKWADYNPKGIKYQVPQPVYNVIGGGGNGGARNKTPAAGWTDPLLETAFTRATLGAMATQSGAPPSEPESTLAPLDSIATQSGAPPSQPESTDLIHLPKTGLHGGPLRAVSLAASPH